MYAHTPMHTAEIWKKDVDFFYFLKSFLSLIGINVSHYIGVFVLDFLYASCSFTYYESY